MCAARAPLPIQAGFQGRRSSYAKLLQGRGKDVLTVIHAAAAAHHLATLTDTPSGGLPNGSATPTCLPRPPTGQSAHQPACPPACRPAPLAFQLPLCGNNGIARQRAYHAQAAPATLAHACHTHCAPDAALRVYYGFAEDALLEEVADQTTVSADSRRACVAAPRATTRALAPVAVQTRHSVMRLAAAAHGAAAACFDSLSSREAVEFAVERLLAAARKPDCVSGLPNGYREAESLPDRQG